MTISKDLSEGRGNGTAEMAEEWIIPGLMRGRKAPAGRPLIMSTTFECLLDVVSEEPGCRGQGSDVSLKLTLEARHQLSGDQPSFCQG